MFLVPEKESADLKLRGRELQSGGHSGKKLSPLVFKYTLIT